MPHHTPRAFIVGLLTVPLESIKQCRHIALDAVKPRECIAHHKGRLQRLIATGLDEHIAGARVHTPWGIVGIPQDQLAVVRVRVMNCREMKFNCRFRNNTIDLAIIFY